MSKPECVTCRWWNGDRAYAPTAWDERRRHGKCQRVVASPALTDDTPIRLYPVGVNAWVDTRYDFSCRDWEKQAAKVDYEPILLIICPHCSSEIDKPTGAVNRARRDGYEVYCSRLCSGLARRVYKSDAQKKEEKAIYDAVRRAKLWRRLKAEKATYYERTKDREKERVVRQRRMPQHVEYCRRPEYRKKKAAYDLKRRAAEFGEFAEAYLLALDINREVKQRMNRYEIYQERGTLNKSTRRKRAARAGTVALG